MLGDKAAGSIINAPAYLSTCGRKVVKVQGLLNDKLSFEKLYHINVKTPSGASCDPTAPTPTRAPKGMPVPVPVPVSRSCPAQVTGFTLVNANTASDIMPLGSYSMSDVPDSLSIRADIRACSPKVVESVFIDFDGMTRCESFAPYTVFGDVSKQDLANDKANYRGQSISAGPHTIKATPYTSDSCRGTAGRTHTLTFTVEDDDDYY